MDSFKVPYFSELLGATYIRFGQKIDPSFALPTHFLDLEASTAQVAV